ncbi:MAG: ABC transporter permease, partial [Geminicoccaceae bacterium]
MSVASGKGQRLLSGGAWLLLGFLVLPALVALPVSLTPKRFLSMPGTEISFQHYQNLFTNAQWLSSAFQSLVIALTAAAIATVLGTLCAVGLWRLSSRFGEMLRGLLLLPLIIPPIISAMTFYRAWVQLGWLDSYIGIIIA